MDHWTEALPKLNDNLTACDELVAYFWPGNFFPIKVAKGVKLRVEMVLINTTRIAVFHPVRIVWLLSPRSLFWLSLQKRMSNLPLLSSMSPDASHHIITIRMTKKCGITCWYGCGSSLFGPILLRRRAFMKKLATVDRSRRRCSAIVCCISREGRWVSLKIA